jgi:hypothetical protein
LRRSVRRPRKSSRTAITGVEDQDGDAQAQITKLTPAQEPEIIKIDKEEAVLQLNFDATYSADLSYNDLGTASYDSEDGRLIYAERRREEVEREQKLVIEVRATYDQVDPGSFEIIDISLSDPPRWLWHRVPRLLRLPI